MKRIVVKFTFIGCAVLGLAFLAFQLANIVAYADWCGAFDDAYFAQPVSGATATGGTITTNGGYLIHTFTNDGTFTVSGGSLNCEVLLGAGGGGGGGQGDTYEGGGGGAGGLTNIYGLACTGSITVTIGKGGEHGVSVGSAVCTLTTVGTNGENSSFGTFTVNGGGGGGAASGYYAAGRGTKNNGVSGGSGGGAGCSYLSTYTNGGSGVIGQGFGGGDSTAENGGYGGTGGGATSKGILAGSFGGSGLVSAITGITTTYAVGGGRGYPAPSDEMPNTCNGGDGAAAAAPAIVFSGQGGSGIAIVRYEIP